MKKYLILAAFFALPAHAAPTSELLKCSAIKGGVERLACFDGLASKDQDAADQVAEKTLNDARTTLENWRISIGKSKIDDSETVVLMTKSTEPVYAKFQKQVHPSLIIRCERNVTSTYVVFDGLFMSDISGNGQVTFRLNKEKPFVQSLAVSGDHQALGLWYGQTAIPFLKRIMTGDTLLVQATPHSDSPIIVTFDISGLDKQIEPLRKACKW